MEEVAQTLSLRELRERLGLTQVDAASRLGVVQGTIRGWEIGRGTPSFFLIRPLMELYDLTFDELEAAVRQTLKESGKS